MSGKRILDAAAIAKASGGVAAKHFAYRRFQLDTYNKTSTLARALKAQTDRIALTVRAASASAERFNGADLTYSTKAEASTKAQGYSSVSSQRGVKDAPDAAKEEQGLGQDHFYNRSQENTTAEPLHEEKLKVEQVAAKGIPLPDGSTPFSRWGSEPQESGPKGVSSEAERVPPARTNISSSSEAVHTPPADKAKRLQRQAEKQIPSEAAKPPPPPAYEGDELRVDQEQDTFYNPPQENGQVLSSLPRVKLPKSSEDTQKSDPHVPDGQMNQDVFYSSDPVHEEGAVPQAQAYVEQEAPTEEMYSQLFQSPKVAKALRGQSDERKSLKDSFPRDAQVSESNGTKPPQDLGQEFSTSKASNTRGHQGNEAATMQKAQDVASEDDARRLAEDMTKDTETSQMMEEKDPGGAQAPYEMHESRVPSSRFGRLWQYGGLATSMAFGAVGESFRRVTGSREAGSSLMLSAGNMERLVAKLSRMRGAALKLGQMMSFQDSKMLPAPINEVLQRVQDSADYMPASQRSKVLSSNLGSDWRDLFSTFDEKPIAAASIGQVHRGVLKSTGMPVAIKVQYPGVANSIDSDLNNLSILLTASRLLPKGLYLDKTIANARKELALECDYIREAEAGKRFQKLLQDEKDIFTVPTIIDEASGAQVLTMEMMSGIGVTKIRNFTQKQKDWIGTQILRLCLREITEFKYMQTDPNWTNFLYNAENKKLELLDFGASREYLDQFIIPYIKVLQAASRNDRKAVHDLSIQLGYLTGYESQTMLNAHVDSVLTLAEPFSGSAPEEYDFRDQTITDRVRGLIPVMLRERLAPPPEETYSLHRKLSGAFLLCARLGSSVRCREMFENAMQRANVT